MLAIERAIPPVPHLYWLRDEADGSRSLLHASFAGGWSALGRWRNSLEEHRTLEALGGLEYSTCCWAMRAAYRRYQFSFDTVALEPRYTNGIYFQLELKGLSRIGAGFQSLVPALQ